MKKLVRTINGNEATAASADRSARRNNRRVEIRVARTLDDLLMVFTIRAAVYMAEQGCPFAEEFDGNDHCANHFLGFVDGEPAGCLRARFFGSFAKLERLAVRKDYRRSSLALISFGRESIFVAAKGLIASTAILAKAWRRSGPDLGLSQCQTASNSCSPTIVTLKWY